MEEKLYKINWNNKTLYIHVWISDNPPYNRENAGCYGFDIFKDTLFLYDGGEVDFEKSEDSKQWDCFKVCVNRK